MRVIVRAPGALMPTRWWIPLDGVRPERVKLEHVHAAISCWFDRTAEQHADGVKPYAISPLARGEDGRTGFEVSTLTASAESLLDIASAPPATVRLGIDRAIVGRPICVANESWEALAQPSGADSWDLEFVTPVTFRLGNRASPLPVAGAVLRGLVASCNALSELPERDLTRQHSDDVWVSDIRGESRWMTLSGLRLSAFTGRVVYRCDVPGTRDLVDALFRLAPYAGVGSAKAKGLGVTLLHPNSHWARRTR